MFDNDNIQVDTEELEGQYARLERLQATIAKNEEKVRNREIRGWELLSESLVRNCIINRGIDWKTVDLPQLENILNAFFDEINIPLAPKLSGILSFKRIEKYNKSHQWEEQPDMSVNKKKIEANPIEELEE